MLESNTMSPRSDIRPEIQNFLGSCEHLLLFLTTSPHSPLSKDEIRLMNHYVDELARVLDKSDKA